MENNELKIISELKRCIGCKVSPCATNCPVGVSPTNFIALALKGDYEEAASLIRSKNPLAETCGHICPDTFCQKKCIRQKIDFPIHIPYLQASITQKIPQKQLELPKYNGKHIAIVGGGPSALGACWQLIQYGYKVSIFEKENQLGGALRLIPDYRLPKSILDKEISYITDNDRTTVHLNHEIKDFSALKNNYEDVILALGEQTPHKLGAQGEELAVPYKTILSSPSTYKTKKVCIVGGGEVALDCALTLKKHGSQIVEMFVRRRQTDMRIMQRDFKELEDRGIVIRELTSVTSIKKAENNTLCLETIHNTITENNKASPIPNTNQTLKDYDLVVTALGSTCKQDNITSFHQIGDMTGLCGTAVEALASGIKLAKSIHKTQG